MTGKFRSPSIKSENKEKLYINTQYRIIIVI